MIEQLQTSITKILSSASDGLSEYELISALKQEPEAYFAEDDLQQPHTLFQVHFLIFHCLYRLREQWLAVGEACLQIDAMKIQRLPYSNRASNELAVKDNVRDYYLNISHLRDTTAEQADELLNQFWQKFLVAEDKTDALKALALDSEASYQQVKDQYRRLAMENHPDRGGDAKRLAEINNAMDVLKRYYR